MALKRYQSLCRKLRTNPERSRSYSEIINTWLEKGYARKMTDSEVHTQSPITWYLPHHDVYTSNKTRVVQDCAARYAGTSLNDKLLTGLDLLNSLTAVLLNFRRGSIGLSADIESMFHRVLCLKTDRDCLRFLWSDDLLIEQPDMFQMCVHPFGAKSSPTCANYALRCTATDNTDKFSSLAVETSLRNFYMDDLCTSQPSVDLAISLSHELVDLLSIGGFRLTKWVSNSRDVLSSLPASEVVIKNFDLYMDAMPSQQVLGFIWDTNEDAITFRTLQSNPPATKRCIIRTIATIFDPCGLCGPFILAAKQLMQILWKRALAWDDDLPEDLLSMWQSWLADLPNIAGIRVSRCYSPDLWEAPTVEVHIFCDGSEISFGSVAYLRIVSANGTISVAFLLSKTRIAPVKKLTMPRLELQAAVLAARIYLKLKEELHFDVTKAVF
ncbi:uncharacterized protein LOC106177694 [Lingula anatina]|uniref:Uncharacterized protein LOC106177694 n=1 Tax=Lingula anatina TaxID=7574 RepID=A0A1S3K142_LINAN|nr:uncharacterized protein LOC106177694 [Lingula anatina]|eukprot:XP_013415996.1 uncharacterized protein LOC106177694 [Lingula anatina]